MEARLEEELSKVLKAKEELVLKISSMDDQSKKDKNSIEQVGRLKEDIVDLTDKLSTLKTSRDECIMIYILFSYKNWWPPIRLCTDNMSRYRSNKEISRSA